MDNAIEILNNEIETLITLHFTMTSPESKASLEQDVSNLRHAIAVLHGAGE